MSARVLTLVVLGCTTAGACREDKRAARERADAAPVEVATTPEQLLAGGAVGRIQDALERAGHGAAWKRGELDEATAAAIAAFQRSRGLPATGVPDRRTASELGLSPRELFERRPP